MSRKTQKSAHKKGGVVLADPLFVSVKTGRKRKKAAGAAAVESAENAQKWTHKKGTNYWGKLGICRGPKPEISEAIKKD